MAKKILIITATILFSVACNIHAQTPIMLGFNPSITLKSDYPKGALDFNILPLVVEVQIVNNVNFRAISLVNYGIRPYGSALINIGAEIAVPFYINLNSNQQSNPNGFFVAVGSAFKRNVHYKHRSTSIFFEPGYNFIFNDKFSLILDLQYGRTFYAYDNGSKLTTNHFGVKVILGWWIG